MESLKIRHLGASRLYKISLLLLLQPESSNLKNKYTNQAYTRCNNIITPSLVNSNKELTKELNYTISPFIHVPFPQHIVSDSATCPNSTEYSKIIKNNQNNLSKIKR